MLAHLKAAISAVSMFWGSPSGNKTTATRQEKYVPLVDLVVY
jgi:hypothetical protein